MATSTSIIPTQRQLEFMDWEFGAFFHFGIRTFFPDHQDWDERPMPASAFDPDDLDCEEWIRTIRDAGARYAILVCKHHDGFANWPCAYTDYSVAASPWKNGRGDVVREFVDACRKYDLKVGLYYSPAQWGGKVHFDHDEEYDDYFIGQLSELLTNYGQIDYLWFDGCGSENHHYDRDRIIAAIRAMQRDILIFNMWDPDTRWSGNEDGYAPYPCLYEVDAVDFSVNTTEKDALDRKLFLPPECDCKMRSTWFDCTTNVDTVKMPQELLGLYEMSVGRGANLLLNIGPDRTGHLPKADVEALRGFSRLLAQRYGRSLDTFSPPERIAEDAWQIRSVAETAQPVNRVCVMEDLTKGQRIIRWALYADLPNGQHQRAKLCEGDTIGHKALIAFPVVRTKTLTLRVETKVSHAFIRVMQAYYSE